MFLAVGMDANNQILLIAYGICKTESLNGKAQNDMWWATCKAYIDNDFQHHLNMLVKHRPDVTSNSAESVNALSSMGCTLVSKRSSSCNLCEVHRATYAESVYPVPDPLNWEIPEDFSEIATPHMNKRQAGRPLKINVFHQKVRILGQENVLDVMQ
ncbi:hypothetical protein QVD17_28789 [Tagetes erecta]|uniref:Uncharacterized protein n=1 Tax=Tagetes erecta TaxID=13708 RepID=A0AAD8KDZ7_TARER|nr:hypothetical protein QVD17_28789 [Tagetes erecta]